MLKFSIGWLHFSLLIGKGPDIHGHVTDIWFRVVLSDPQNFYCITIPFVGSFCYCPGSGIPAAFSSWADDRRAEYRGEMA